jgi:hypothetical protein
MVVPDFIASVIRVFAEEYRVSAAEALVGGAIGRGAGSCSYGDGGCRRVITDSWLHEQMVASQSGQRML